MLIDYYKDLLRQRFSGRRVILANGPLATMKEEIARVRELGSERPFILAETRGTGDIPTPEEAEAYVVGTPAGDLMTAVRSYDLGLQNLAPHVRRALDAYDPDSSAIVIRSLFGCLREVAGRKVWGPRRPEWLAVEDKTVIDGLLSRAGVQTTTAQVVVAETGALEAAHAAVDIGCGTVWAADNTEGWHGGASYTRIVQTAEHLSSATAFMQERAKKVRVMPFLEGVPCSIHGTVFPQMIATYRPMEMVVLRRPLAGQFFYAGASNHWEPKPEDTEAMREVARKVGRQLQQEVGFRGSFTVDGVMTADGFRPTEVNPRYGAALALLLQSLPELPMYLLDLAVSHGEAWDFRPEELQQLIREAGARRPSPRAGISIPRAREETTTHYLARRGRGYDSVSQADDADVIVRWGPGPMGSYMRVAIAEHHLQRGASVAEVAAEIARWGDAQAGGLLGPIEAPRTVR